MKHNYHGKGSGKKRKNMPGYHLGADSIGRKAWLADETVQALHDKHAYVTQHAKTGDIIGIAKGLNVTVLGKHKGQLIIFDPKLNHVRLTSLTKLDKVPVRSQIDIFAQFPHLLNRKIMGTDVFVKDAIGPHQPIVDQGVPQSVHPQQSQPIVQQPAPSPVVEAPAPDLPMGKFKVGDDVQLDKYHPHAAVGDQLLNSKGGTWTVIGITKDHLIMSSDKIAYPYAVKVSSKFDYKIKTLGTQKEIDGKYLQKKVMAASKFVPVLGKPGETHTVQTFIMEQGGQVVAPHVAHQSLAAVQAPPKPAPIAPPPVSAPLPPPAPVHTPAWNVPPAPAKPEPVALIPHFSTLGYKPNVNVDPHPLGHFLPTKLQETLIQAVKNKESDAHLQDLYTVVNGHGHSIYVSASLSKIQELTGLPGASPAIGKTTHQKIAEAFHNTYGVGPVFYVAVPSTSAKASINVTPGNNKSPFHLNSLKEHFYPKPKDVTTVHNPDGSTNVPNLLEYLKQDFPQTPKKMGETFEEQGQADMFAAMAEDWKKDQKLIKIDTTPPTKKPVVSTLEQAELEATVKQNKASSEGLVDISSWKESSKSGNGGFQKSKWYNGPDGKMYLAKQNQDNQSLKTTTELLGPSAVAEMISTHLAKKFDISFNEVQLGVDAAGRTISLHKGIDGLIEGTAKGYTQSPELTSSKEMVDIGIFNTFVVNVDCHSGNLMIDGHGKLVAIDNGYLIHPSKHSDADFTANRLKAILSGTHTIPKLLQDVPITPEVVEHAKKTWEKFSKLTDKELEDIVNSIHDSAFTLGSKTYLKSDYVDVLKSRRDAFAAALKEHANSAEASLYPAKPDGAGLSTWGDKFQHSIHSLAVEAAADLVKDGQVVEVNLSNGTTLFISKDPKHLTRIDPSAVSSKHGNAKGEKIYVSGYNTPNVEFATKVHDLHKTSSSQSGPKSFDQLITDHVDVPLKRGADWKRHKFGQADPAQGALEDSTRFNTLADGLKDDDVIQWTDNTGRIVVMSKNEDSIRAFSTVGNASYKLTGITDDENIHYAVFTSPNKQPSVKLHRPKPAITPAEELKALLDKPSIFAESKFDVRKLDSDSIDKTFNFAASGTFTAMKDSKIEDQLVKTVAIHKGDGSIVRFESQFRINDETHSALIQEHFIKHGKDVSDELWHSTAPDDEGRFVQTGQQETIGSMFFGYLPASSYRVYRHTTPDGTEMLYVKSDYAAYNGIVKVLSPNKDSVEKSLHSALETTGLEKAYAQAADLEAMKWRKASKSALPHMEYAKLKNATPEQIQKVLQEKYPNVTKILDDEVMDIGSGYTVPTFSREFFEKIIAPEVKEVFSTMTTPPSNMKSFMKSGGMISTLQRFSFGFKFSGMSSLEDIQTGGAQSIFTRLAKTRKQVQVGDHLGGGTYFRYHPELLRRTDHYSFAGDGFGVADKKHSKWKSFHEPRVQSWETLKKLGHDAGKDITNSGGNETMFKYGIQPHHIEEMMFVKDVSSAHSNYVSALQAYRGLADGRTSKFEPESHPNWNNEKGTVVFKDDTPPKGQGVPKLNGIEMKPVEKNYWEKTPDAIKEPPLPVTNKKQAAGCLVVEPDGRIWLVSPTNEFGGYKNTFPKGGVENGLSHQQNAMKEVFEEAGLQVKIHSFLGDFEGDTSSTRYYIAHRTGGEPWKTDTDATGFKETDNVKLVSLDEAKSILNKSRDQKILDAYKAAGAPKPEKTAEGSTNKTRITVATLKAGKVEELHYIDDDASAKALWDKLPPDQQSRVPGFGTPVGKYTPPAANAEIPF